MKIFYTMYLNSGLPLGELFQVVQDVLPQGEITENDGKTLCIANDGFYFSVESDSLSLKFASEDYNAKFDCNFYIQVFMDTPTWRSDLFGFVQHLLKIFNGALLFLINGDVPVIFRRSVKMYVNEDIVEKVFPWNMSHH